MAEGRTDRPLGDLIGTLTSQLGTLIRKEIELARTELTANATRTLRDASLIGVGAAVAYAGFLALVAAAIALLVDIGLTLWVAGVAVAVVLFIVGWILIQGGRTAIERASMAPRRTMESLRQDVELAKDATHD